MKPEHSLTIGERLCDERKRLGLTQSKFADAAAVSARSQGNYESNKRKPNAAYWSAVTDKFAVDVQYVLTGKRSENIQTFENKLEELQRVSQLVEKIAKNQNPQPDAYSLGPLRDLAYQAHLSGDQLTVIFDLLQQARKPEFWGKVK